MVREIDSQALRALLENPEALTLVDIRTPAEVASGVIASAIHVPMHLLPLRQTELPRDKDLILYCRTGARSYHACQFLMQQGFDNALNLRGGIVDWARQGFAITLR